MNTLFIFGAKYLFIVIPLIALIYFIKLERKKQKALLIFAAIALPAIYIVGKIAGLLYYDQRPFVAHNFIPLITSSVDNGFPSDHTLFCAGIAMVIFLKNRQWGIGLWLITILVAISRVYVGVHSPLDVIGSMVIAIITGGLVYKLLSKN